MATRQLSGDTTDNDLGYISRSLDCFTSNFSKAVCDTASYYRLLIGNHTLAFDWSYFWWPWSTLEGHFSLGCHFHLHFSNPWHAFASHGLPATAELLVFMFLLFILKHLVSHYWPPLCSAMRSIIVSVRLCLSVCVSAEREKLLLLFRPLIRIGEIFGMIQWTLVFNFWFSPWSPKIPPEVGAAKSVSTSHPWSHIWHWQYSTGA